LAHARVFTMDAAGFAADIGDARKALEDASGARVTGYRAPSFSIDTRTPWAHEILTEQGYLYSSSVAPLRMTITVGARRRALLSARWRGPI
jgi:hypothetical protein